MEESGPTEKEEINSNEIHKIEIETTIKSVVVTSEKSHTERTQETAEKVDDTPATNDEAQASNGISDNSVMRINEESPSQITQEESSHLEERPTEQGMNEVAENCHESGSGHTNVSEAGKIDSESGATEQSPALSESNTITNSLSAENEDTRKVEEEVTHPELNLDNELRDENVETVQDEHSRERDIEVSQETEEEINSNNLISHPEEQQEHSRQASDNTQKTEECDISSKQEMPEIAPEIPKEAEQTESEQPPLHSGEQPKEPNLQTEPVKASCPLEAEKSEPAHTKEEPLVNPAEPLTTAESHTVEGTTQMDSAEPSSGAAEIQEGNLKNQLQEIIKEIDREVDKDEEEEPETGGPPHHTWKPKKKYEVQKVEVKYEDIVPITLPDVTFTERKIEEPQPAPEPSFQKQQPPTAPPKPKKPQVNGEPLTPVELPEGLPLLAKIAPKEGSDEASRDKIPLERLFTPATDSGDLTPKKRKIYASSAFYRPDHPTIEDQVDLAHKISVSLIDEENKASKGHSMYMKRKNRSSKWIHAGDYVEEEDLMPPKESKQRPALKLLMNPKGLHDYTSIQQSYEEMASSSQMSHNLNSIEGCKEIISDMQSPTGKGAALFAKRKKRMDKFIVDENSVQKTCTTTSKTTTQENAFQSSHQEEVQTIANSLSMLPSSIESTSAGSLILPDITKILTQTKPVDKKSTKLRGGSKGKSNVKREYSWNISSSKKETSTSTKNPSFNSAIPPPSYEPDINLRPGTPPLFVVSDQRGNLLDKSANFASTSDTQDQSNSEGGAIYTAEVKVVQSPSVPATPIIEPPTPQDIVSLDRLSSDSLEDKRKSFNLAAKGWGTYNNFYTPLHLSTS